MIVNLRLRVAKCNSYQDCNKDKCHCECKIPITHLCKTYYTWKSSSGVGEINKCLKIYNYMKSFIDYLVIRYDRIIDTTETLLINSANKKT